MNVGNGVLYHGINPSTRVKKVYQVMGNDAAFNPWVEIEHVFLSKKKAKKVAKKLSKKHVYEHFYVEKRKIK